jgi:hypothetical protein
MRATPVGAGSPTSNICLPPPRDQTPAELHKSSIDPTLNPPTERELRPYVNNLVEFLNSKGIVDPDGARFMASNIWALERRRLEFKQRLGIDEATIKQANQANQDAWAAIQNYKDAVVKLARSCQGTTAPGEEGAAATRQVTAGQRVRDALDDLSELARKFRAP